MSITTNPSFIIGVSLLGILLVLMAVFVIFCPFSITIDMDHRMEAPSRAYLLGTDSMGRDFLSCVVYGIGVSLVIGLLVAVLSGAVGVGLGMVAGYIGGIIDIVIMGITEVFLAFPGILLAIVAAAFLGPGPVHLIALLVVMNWAGYARMVRAEVLKHKQAEFMMAARSYNASTGRIIVHHLFPLVLPLAVVQVSLNISGIILAESSIHFLGIGLSADIPTLGQLINEGRDYLFNDPIFIALPGGILFLIIIAFHFIADGLSKKNESGLGANYKNN
ncbi:MAG: ABC transporter permease [Candidatus Omnitrophota bacterium]